MAVKTLPNFCGMNERQPVTLSNLKSKEFKFKKALVRAEIIDATIGNSSFTPYLQVAGRTDLDLIEAKNRIADIQECLRNSAIPTLIARIHSAQSEIKELEVERPRLIALYENYLSDDTRLEKGLARMEHYVSEGTLTSADLESAEKIKKDHEARSTEPEMLRAKSLWEEARTVQAFPDQKKEDTQQSELEVPTEPKRQDSPKPPAMPFVENPVAPQVEQVEVPAPTLLINILSKEVEIDGQKLTFREGLSWRILILFAKNPNVEIPGSQLIKVAKTLGYDSSGAGTIFNNLKTSIKYRDIDPKMLISLTIPGNINAKYQLNAKVEWEGLFDVDSTVVPNISLLERKLLDQLRFASVNNPLLASDAIRSVYGFDVQIGPKEKDKLFKLIINLKNRLKPHGITVINKSPRGAHREGAYYLEKEEESAVLEPTEKVDGNLNLEDQKALLRAQIAALEDLLATGDLPSGKQIIAAKAYFKELFGEEYQSQKENNTKLQGRMEGELTPQKRKDAFLRFTKTLPDGRNIEVRGNIRSRILDIFVDSYDNSQIKISQELIANALYGRVDSNTRNMAKDQIRLLGIFLKPFGYKINTTEVEDKKEFSLQKDDVSVGSAMPSPASPATIPSTPDGENEVIPMPWEKPEAEKRTVEENRVLSTIVRYRLGHGTFYLPNIYDELRDLELNRDRGQYNVGTLFDIFVSAYDKFQKEYKYILEREAWSKEEKEIWDKTQLLCQNLAQGSVVKFKKRIERELNNATQNQ